MARMSVEKIREIQCQNCNNHFSVVDQDLEFLDKVSPIINGQKFAVPAPTFCPDCRQQRRLSFRNERRLYHRKCDLCSKAIISVYSKDKPYQVYCQKCWWSDQYDGLNYAQDFNFSRSFFDQYQELKLKVPRPALSHKNCQNSDFCNEVDGLKNCYLVVGSHSDESCLYSSVMIYSKDCVDCLNLTDCELCYECIDCKNCYNCKFAVYCKNVADSSYVFNCIQSKNLLFCSGLKNTEYQILNTPYSAEGFEKKKAEILSSRQLSKEYLEKYSQLRSQTPAKYITGALNENCSGNWLDNCKNVDYGFEAIKCENSKFVYEVWELENCHDVYCFYGPGRWCYEVYGGLGAEASLEKMLFTNSCWPGYEILYSEYSFGSQYLFGCIGINKKRYCILNKQYSKEEYGKLVPQIIEHMKKTGEWGQYFPASISSYGYNESIAQEYFPLLREVALEKGYLWKEDDAVVLFQGQKPEVPSGVVGLSDEMAQNIYICQGCQKNYRFIKEEIHYHQKIAEPLSKFCPNCRHMNRRLQRNPRKLWERECLGCSAKIQTSYSPERPEKVFCEPCYLKEVY